MSLKDRRENYIKMTKYINTLNIEELKHLDEIAIYSDHNITRKYQNKIDTEKQISYLKKNWNLLSEFEEREFDRIENKMKYMPLKALGVIGGISGCYFGLNYKRISNKTFFLSLLRRGFLFGSLFGFFFVKVEKKNNFGLYNRLYFSVINRNFGDQDVF